MAITYRRVHRDTLVWAAILAGHGLLLVLVLRIESQSGSRNPEAAAAKAMFWLSLTPPPVARQNSKQPVPANPKTLPRRALQPDAPAPSPPITTPEPSPRIDWSREAAVAAAAAAQAASAAADRATTLSPPPQALRKPCQPRESSMKWQPSRVGMAGTEGGLHLPYVALGKRCVIGLGFFGCAMGELPEVNGHLLDDMHDPNLSRSSVPAVDACE
jgi:hypothetical protein